MIHYKGKAWFLANVMCRKRTTEVTYGVRSIRDRGSRGHNGAEGTWRDAEDGELSSA